MGENVTFFGDLADKYDALVAYDEKLLDQYVEESGYSLTAMALASTTIAFMEFAKGFTDIGRLGNGVLIERGWKGVGKDVLRALNVIGTAGAMASRGSSLLKLVQAPKCEHLCIGGTDERLAIERPTLSDDSRGVCATGRD
jgi:hypothetical protein